MFKELTINESKLRQLDDTKILVRLRQRRSL